MGRIRIRIQPRGVDLTVQIGESAAECERAASGVEAGFDPSQPIVVIGEAAAAGAAAILTDYLGINAACGLAVGDEDETGDDTDDE